MSRDLDIARDAASDLTFIWIYYAEKSERAAARIRQEILATYNTLLTFPRMGRFRDELRKGLRSFPSGDHMIFYRETANGIKIVRVLHGSQDVYSVFPPEDADESPAI